MRLTNEEMNEIYGGKGAGLIIIGILALGTIIVGIFDGFTRPLECHE